MHIIKPQSRGLSLAKRRIWYAATDKAFDTSLLYDGQPMQQLAGAAIPAGQIVYLDTNNRLQKALGNALSTSVVYGWTLTEAKANGQPVMCAPLANGGNLSGLTGFVVGAPWFLSETTPGSAMRVADLGAGDVSVYLGFSPTAATFAIGARNSTAVHA